MLIKPPAGDSIWTIKQVAACMGLAQSTLEAHIRLGKFPQPLKLTNGIRPRIGWMRSTVEGHRARLAAEAEARTAERTTETTASVVPVGHLELRYATEDRAAVAVRRLQRFGFRCDVRPVGGKFACVVALERGSVPHTLDSLQMCARDVVAACPPVFVEHATDAGAAP